MSAGAAAALVAAGIVVGVVLGALVRNVFMVTWGAWLLFWDELSYFGRRALEMLGGLAVLVVAAGVVYLIVK